MIPVGWHFFNCFHVLCSKVWDFNLWPITTETFVPKRRNVIQKFEKGKSTHLTAKIFLVNIHRSVHSSNVTKAPVEHSVSSIEPKGMPSNAPPFPERPELDTTLYKNHNCDNEHQAHILNTLLYDGQVTSARPKMKWLLYNGWLCSFHLFFILWKKLDQIEDFR